MSLLPADKKSTVATGIWYAAPALTQGHWKQYLDIKKNDSSGVIENNPFHLWMDGKKLNLLVIDYGGCWQAVTIQTR
jgi:hypothetical protein